MKSVFEEVYLVCPIPIQNIMVSLKGLSIERTRHSGNYQSYLKEVMNRREWSFEEFFSYQFSVLKKVITNASLYVPYYRKLFRKIGFHPNELKSMEYIQKLPLLEKESIRKNPLEFVDERIKRKNLLNIHTTGTTGTPLTVYANKDVRQWNYAFFDEYQISLGIDPTKKRATIGGRVICHPDQSAPPFWRYSLFQRNLLFSSYHLTSKNLPYYVDKLHSYQPEIIDSYPSSLFTIAEHMLKTGQRGHVNPKCIITSAATLFDEQRATIEDVFQCKVSDQYGAAEMSIFVAQCCKGNYHYRPDYCLVEVIKNGKTVKPGEVGEIVCTGLINDVMPLIRYRIGDLGILSQERCSCGLNTPLFSQIIGRIDDIIITPDGRYVGRLSPVLKGFPVKEAQYIQRRIDEVIVRIIKASSFKNDSSEHIIRELRKRLGHDISIQLEFVDRIERGPGGKLRTVISAISNKDT